MALIKTTYRDNSLLKRCGISEEFTQEQAEEYVKCMDDPIYFCKTYMKIVNVDEGLMPFRMWDFQEDMIHKFHDNRFTITKLPRQVGKTTTTVGYLLWVTLFQETQSIAILANKGSLSRDILAKYQLAYENLPRWLQQGVVEWNKGNVELENGSKILASSTSSSAIRGGSFNIVFLDEFAFVPTNMATEFFNSVYPVISSGKNTKIIIVSTPNGMNMFYKLWTDAKKGKNEYVTTEIMWNQVPGRDEAWKEQTIRNTSEQQFRQEFLTEFLGSSNTLIDGQKLQIMPYIEPIKKHANLNIFEEPIKGNYEETIKDHLYMITVDVSEGRNLDYSTFSVMDVSTTPYRQVARFRDNTISPILFPTVIYNAARHYNDAYILVEINNNPQVAEILHNDMEYENVLKVQTGNKKAQTVCAGFGRGVQMGVKMSPLVKRMGCSNLKTLIESDKLIVNDFDTISELTTFVAEGNSFAADGEANDDMVMSLVLFAWLTSQVYFKDIVMHDVRKQLQLEEFSQVDEEMLPVGELNDGLDAPFVVEDDDVWDSSGGPAYANYFRSIQQ
jgi:Terminase large subunit, T4likevirus-type, N-terminal/Terminase RNaseH-like domain